MVLREERRGRREEAGREIELEKQGRESEWQRAGFLNAHSRGQSLELLCAGNTKRRAPCSRDNGLMGVLGQLRFQRARGERCPSLSALSNRPERHKDTL